ncbi:hypothetical protein [Pontibacter sp. H249]|uniref:hypothetical protein n=1 Tax=Pontibacter sp. H249 TaxID=3133420 RepID=UPI0030C51DD9
MTRLLYYVSDRLKGVDISGDREVKYRNVFSFYYAVLALRLFSFLWLYWTAAKYLQLQQRPTDIFWFDHTLVKWLMPSLPNAPLFFGVLALAVVCNGWQLIKSKSSFVLQLPLALSLLWLNLPQWGYGFLSHVNHTFLLAHLFLVFIPISKASLQHPGQQLHKSINWFYAGILFTYTLAGLWKIPSLLYKLLLNTTDVHWLHPHASLYNAFVSFRNYDLPFNLAPVFTDYALFWQLSFLVVVYLQSASIVAAFRQELRPLMGVLLVLFHGMNMLVFQTYFVVATLVLLCLLLPYDVLLGNKFRKLAADLQTNFTEAQPAISTLTPFECFRQRVKSKSFYLSGILFLPGVRMLANGITRIAGKL